MGSGLSVPEIDVRAARRDAGHKATPATSWRRAGSGLWTPPVEPKYALRSVDVHVALHDAGQPLGVTVHEGSVGPPVVAAVEARVPGIAERMDVPGGVLSPGAGPVAVGVTVGHHLRRPRDGGQLDRGKPGGHPVGPADAPAAGAKGLARGTDEELAVLHVRLEQVVPVDRCRVAAVPPQEPPLCQVPISLDKVVQTVLLLSMLIFLIYCSRNCFGDILRLV